VRQIAFGPAHAREARDVQWLAAMPRALRCVVLVATAALAACAGEIEDLGDDAPADPSTPPAVGPGAPDASTPTGLQQLCVDTINDYRATLGLTPYTRWTSAEACSDGEAKSDSESGQAHGAFGRCGEFAQNECPGWGGPPEQMIKDCLALMWAEGPGGGHYENMRGGYTHAACGFHVTPSGKIWAVQNFK
jgi:hypothetical protein